MEGIPIIPRAVGAGRQGEHPVAFFEFYALSLEEGF
jgi:hypothetical protein